MAEQYGPSTHYLLALFTVSFLSIGDSVADNQVSFFLFTKNWTASKEIYPNDTCYDLRNKNFEPNHPTKILVHGFVGITPGPEFRDIQEEYLKKIPMNVIDLNWKSLAAGKFISDYYPTAVRNVAYVGKCLAELINRLRECGATDIHVLGFSLGAHVAAVAAKYLKPYNISRITGLDPAGPLR